MPQVVDVPFHAEWLTAEHAGGLAEGDVVLTPSDEAWVKPPGLHPHGTRDDDDRRFVVIYHPQGGGFLDVEPCQHAPRTPRGQPDVPLVGEQQSSCLYGP